MFLLFFGYLHFSLKNVTILHKKKFMFEKVLFSYIVHY